MVLRMSACAALILTVSLQFGCGGNSRQKENPVAGLLPGKIEGTELARTGEIRTFVGDSLWEYINGGAEIYHTYGFVQVSTADYRTADLELVLDLYQFALSDQAYGIYSYLRPDEPGIVRLGVEGFTTSSSLNFVKGQLLVRVTAFEVSPEVSEALLMVGQAMSDILPGTTTPPEMFSVFPAADTVAYTAGFIAESFLGRAALENVYVRKFARGEDTLTLFVTDDRSGGKFADWRESLPSQEHPPYDLPFDSGYCFLTETDFHGNILVGLRAGRLVGAVHYSDQHQEFVANWLESME